MASSRCACRKPFTDPWCPQHGGDTEEGKKIMDEQERATLGCKAFNEHMTNGGTVVEISWKSEDGTLGPAYAYRDAAAQETARMLRPYGSPDPDGVWYLGWQRRGRMSKMAKAIGAKFQEW